MEYLADFEDQGASPGTMNIEKFEKRWLAPSLLYDETNYVYQLVPIEQLPDIKLSAQEFLLKMQDQS